MKTLNLHWRILLAMVFGLAYSWFALSYGYAEFTKTWISPFGDIFIRLLKLLAVPIVLFSIISGVSSLVEAKGLGKLAARSIGFYFFTTLVSISLGILLVNLVAPGKKVGGDVAKRNRLDYEYFALTSGIAITGESQLDKPENAQIVAQIKEDREKRADDKSIQMAKQTSKNKKGLQYVVDMIPENIFAAISDARSMMQVIFFAIFFGVALLFIPNEQVKILKGFIGEFNNVLVKMINMVMEFAPFFVFCLLAGTFTELTTTTQGFVDIFSSLSWYTAVVVLGFVIILFVFYPLFVYVFGKGYSPMKYLSGVKEAQIVAFSTSSSVATLPVTLRCAKEKLSVSDKIANFVIPVGATVNMNGSAIYQVIAVLFLAQFHGVDVSWQAQLTIMTMTLLASVGTAGIPSGAFILLIVLLDTVGLDPYWVAIIMPVDRLLDMMLTVVNITGDMAVATVVQQGEENNK